MRLWLRGSLFASFAGAAVTSLRSFHLSAMKRATAFEQAGATWLLKTEPDEFSLDDLEREGVAPWDKVRNHQAKNNIKAAKIGDRCLIYHTGKKPGIVGISRVVRTAYDDPDPIKPGDWQQMDLQYQDHFKSPVLLSTLKAIAAADPQGHIASLPIFKQPQLSVSPVTPEQLEIFLNLAEEEQVPPKKKAKSN
jgi:predicted RNA-binding protein with PUA-like domain